MDILKSFNYLKENDFSISDENIKFLNLLKEILAKEKKDITDKSKYEIEIKFTDTIPQESSIEFFTFDQLKFKDYFDCSKEYINNALCILTFNFEAKKEKDIEIIKNGYEIINSLFIKDQTNNFRYLYFRNIGKTIFIDFVFFDGKTMKNLLDLGINFNEYEKFNLTINSAFNINDIFSDIINDFKIILYDIFKLIITIKSTRNNMQYLINCINKAINILNLKEYQDIIEVIINYLNFSKVLSKINIELKSNIIIDEIYKLIEKKKKKKKRIQKVYFYLLRKK